MAIRTVTQGTAPDGRTSAQYRYDLRNGLARLDANANGSTDASSLIGWTDVLDLMFVYGPDGNRIGRLTNGGNPITGTWYNIETAPPRSGNQ